jgi:hypothetical protein
MTTSNSTPTQTTGDTNNDSIDNVKIDINELYSSLIVPIDNMRSLVNIAAKDNQTNIAAAVKNLDIADLYSKLTVPSNPTDYNESRFSAFCRTIGFPVIGSNGTFFNPGYDGDTQAIQDSLKFKLQVISSQTAAQNRFFEFRETYYNNTIKENFTQQTSPIVMNLFLLQLAQSDNFLNINSYYGKLSGSSIVSNVFNNILDYKYNLYQITNADKYTDIYGNYGKQQSDSYYFNYPLITDGRIWLTTRPSLRTTTVPFSQNNTYNDNNLKRPLLEKIIKDRFSVNMALENTQFATAANSSYLSKNLQTVQNNTYLSVKDSSILDLYNQINGTQNSPYNDLDKIKIDKFLTSIIQILNILVDNKKIIKKILDEYFWMPTCNGGGPEYGVKSTDIYYTTENVLMTKDKEILVLQQADAIVKMLSNFNTNNKVSPNDYALSTFYNVFSPDQTSGFISSTKESLDKALAERKEELSNAEAALKNIEIITGQVSGLGLLDIFLILAAMHLMKKENLLGFLDDTCYNYANNYIKSITGTPITRPSLSEAYTDLENNLLMLHKYTYDSYLQLMEPK